MEKFLESLLLMVVGMTTVYVVLIVIISIGNQLVKIVNKFAPDEAPIGTKKSTSSNEVDPNIAQAIQLAVAGVTNNKGKVEKIEKK